MEIYTLNVGQGNFNVIVGDKEAFIVDTFIALNPKKPIINIKGALANILNGKELVGLIITGFDDDHFNKVGLSIVLHKYLPKWIMYPRYFKNTSNADECFKIIEDHDKDKKIERYSISLSDNSKRFYYNFSKEFYFEVFSPYKADMSSSNNCSIVCKVHERSSGKTYLITGDTENDRWENIISTFSTSLKADVLAASHHGSRNGCTKNKVSKVAPHTVLISAGVDNQYGHPHEEAMTIYLSTAEKTFRTNYGDGQSLKTIANQTEVVTYLYESK